MDPTQFVNTLRKGQAGPVYFLRGPDRFLHEECRAALIASLPAEAREWCLTEIEFQPRHLERELQSAYQMPMLGGHSLFLFSDPEDFKHSTEEDYDVLRAYLERPSPFATVVFAAVEPDRRRRFIQLLEKKAEVVEMRPLARGEAAAWLKGYLRRAGVDIEPQLAEQIAAKFESSSDSPQETKRDGVNLLWMRTEVEKLLTAQPQAKRLERADLDLMVPAGREEREIGKLLRAIAERQFGKALEQLRALLASKQPETLLLWCIGDLFRQTLTSLPGTTYGRAGWNRFRNPFPTQEIALHALRTYTRQELLQALRLVRQADLGIKSSWKDSRILLEFLIWQIIVGKGSENVLASVEELPERPAEG